MMTGRSSQPIKSVAMIGVGSMGQPMARHIHAAGFDLVLCDANPDALASFARADVKIAGSPAECADCDVVILLVATPEQLKIVAVGENGLRSIEAAHLPRYIVVSSTVAPTDMSALSDAFAGLPTRIVDAPVSGGVVGAQKATLTFLVGGTDADAAALRPLFLAMGKTVFHCGDVGAGQLTKTVNNIIAITNLMVSAEAYGIALANGLTLDKLIPALDAGSARNFLSRDPTDPPEIYRAWSETENAFTGVQMINQKDMDLAMALCPDGFYAPTIESVRRLLQKGDARTLANWRTVANAAQ